MNEEKDELLKVFKDLDINGDGRLTREELLAGKSYLCYFWIHLF